MAADAAPPRGVPYGDAVFGHASALSAVLGTEVSIRRLECECCWLHAPVPDPAAGEAAEAGLYVARLEVPFLAHAGTGVDGSYLRVAIHRPGCRSPAPVLGDCRTGVLGRQL